MNRRIFIVCSKWAYHFVPSVVSRLKQLGYEVILPNYFDDPMIEEKIKNNMTKEEHVEFCRKSFEISEEKVKNTNITLVLNLDKEKDGQIYKNYIGGATFLEIYDSYKEKHPIFLYNDISEGMLYDELEGMNPIILNGDLFKIIENDGYSSFISNENNLLKYFDVADLLKIKSCDDDYLKAAIIVRRLFKDKTDKSGKPYIGHLKRVSDSLDNYKQKVAGLLHDVVEDTDITCRDLVEIGFSLDIVRIVYLVTKPIIDDKNLTKEEKLALYEKEIDEIIISGNNDAIMLKEKDMTDNYNPERLALLPQDKQEWFHKKYGKQLVKLKNINEKRK